MAIVDININRQTQGVTREGFGTLLVLGTHKKFTEKIKFYSTQDEVLNDFSDSDEEAKATNLYFSQTPRPPRVAIGRREADSIEITVTSEDNFTYEVNINGTNFSYTSGTGETATAIAGSLVTAINGGSEPVTATDNNDGTFDISADVSGTAYTVGLSDNLEITDTVTNDSISTDLNNIKNVSNEWYAVSSIQRDTQVIKDIAAWVESEFKIFGFAKSDNNILDGNVSTDIISELNALDYERTFGIYHQNAASTYIEAAWFGSQLTTQPGTSTWAFKSLSGVSTTGLTTTESNAVKDKGGNTYEVDNGNNYMFPGIMIDNFTYIDITRGIDWLRARIIEDLQFRFANLGRIPYTNDGIATIESTIDSRLDNAVAVGLLAANPEPSVSVPNALDVSSTDRANRVLPSVTFNARLQGGIHSVEINGVVTV